jgi:hypothetical protein
MQAQGTEGSCQPCGACYHSRPHPLCLPFHSLTPQDTHPRLYNIITSSMLHGPCGAAYPNCPCMKDGTCSKRYVYPKEFQATTVYSEGAYPLYRRRDDGRTFTR